MSRAVRHHHVRWPALLVAATLAAVSPPYLSAQEEPEEPALVLAEVIVEPQAPAVDTLCKLRVKVTNKGDETASQFGFTISINDVELPVYKNQLFMYPVKAGETLEFPLYNFWSNETARPVPADGKLRLEVVLREAQWMKIEMEDDVEVWTPLGAVPGLPSTQALTLSMSDG